ncbi:afadin-like isoform X2 [Episyrphus balteatus]|nr:afadin-like isoform X2 [Episyrphus balteatus]
MFHVRRRPADSQPRRRKKKPLGTSNENNHTSNDREGPVLVEVTHSGEIGDRIKLGSDPIEVGSANTNSLQLFGPSIQARHCLISLLEGVCIVTPLHADALTFVNGHHVTQPTILQDGCEVVIGRVASYRFLDSPSDGGFNPSLSQTQLDSAYLYERPEYNVSVLENQGSELILPAVLEFPEKHQEQFLKHVVTDLDVNLPNFKLAPAYSLYMCARYRASTHYRPELQPTERAQKLTIFLRHVANLIHSIVHDQKTSADILTFWMANSSEFLNFLKSDRHISAFSIQAQEILYESLQIAFHNLVDLFRVELLQTLDQFLSETTDHVSAAGLVLTVLESVMALLRRYQVNAALTIQLFSLLFHYINAICFNTIVSNSHMCTAEYGKMLAERLQLLELWAKRHGLELAADYHLAKIKQCVQFLESPKLSVEETQKLICTCFRLNSVQIAALLQQEKIPNNLVDTVIKMAESVGDDNNEVQLKESPELHLELLLPDEGFSCDIIRGIPSDLIDFLDPLQSVGICRLSVQPLSIGYWTVYMDKYNELSPSEIISNVPKPEVQIIKFQKNSNGMGLSIVAAKGAGQKNLGIYIKSVVPGGAADVDNRLEAGDQLLRVDEQSLVGITQEIAAEYLVKTGPIVTLEVAKQAAIYHGLASLLQQPSPITRTDSEDATQRLCSNFNSEESLNILNLETQTRRLSVNSLQEKIVDQGQLMTHMDPRYRDNRSIATTSWNVIAANENNNSYISREANPSIYIEEFDDGANLEERPIYSCSDAHQPLNEEGIASVAETDDIPFIDDNVFYEDEEIYKPERQQFPRKPIDFREKPISNTETDGIISLNKRSSNAYRKTVSFDLVEKDEKCDYVCQANSSLKKRSHTTQSISSFNEKISPKEQPTELTQVDNTVLYVNGNHHHSEHPVPTISIPDRKCRRELNTDRSTSRRRSSVSQANPIRDISPAICHSGFTIEVPLNNLQFLSAKNCLPYRRHSHTNVSASPSINADQTRNNNERNDFFGQSLALDYKLQSIQKSDPNLRKTAIESKNLAKTEQIEILKQLKNWSLYSSSPRDSKT